MKTLIITAVLFSFLLIGCKKEVIEPINIESKDQKVDPALFGREVPEEININADGFLTFESQEQLLDFKDFLANSTHYEIQHYFDSIAFRSRGENKYNSQNCEFYDLPNDEQQLDYMLNEDGLVKIYGVILKLNNENTFLLTATESNYDEYVLDDLKNDIYNEYRMNKFVTGRLLSEEFDLFDFIDTTPYGYEETTEPSGEKRKMFGNDIQIVTQWVSTITPGVCYFWQSQYVTTYIFWININSYWGDDIPNSGHYAACP